MNALLLWGGPVARSDLKIQVPADTTVLTVNQGQGGIGSDAFRNLALSYLDADGRILPGLLKAAGLDLDQFDRVSLAGFSAFHGMANEILKHDGDRVSACVCLDACFSSFENVAKPGYVAFGERAARGEVLFVLSGSYGGGQTYTTGSQCVLANVQEAAHEAGLPLDTSPISDLDPQPAQTLHVGNLVGLDYQGAYAHGDHVHVLGQPILERFLLPWWQGRSVDGTSSNDSSSSSSSSWGKAALVTALGLLGIVALSRRSSP